MTANARRTTTGPDLAVLIARLAQRVSDLELGRAADIANATSGSSTIADHSITDTKMVANTLTGASISTGLALQGTLSTPYGFVNNSTGLFVTTTSQFSYNSTFTDPDSGVQRDAKFGQKGIAVGGGTKTDTLNVTGASTMSNSGLTITSIGSFTNSGISLTQDTTLLTNKLILGGVQYTNLITNPSVETSGTGWSPDWYGGGSATGTTALSPGTGMNGGQAYRKTWTVATTGAVSQVGFEYAGVPVTPGLPYSVGVYMRGNNANNCAIFIYWKDSTGATISNTPAANSVSTAANTYGRATQLNQVAPTNAATATLVFGPYPTPGVMAVNDYIEFDQLMMVQGTTLPAYFDGASGASGNTVYAWTGTANASTSTQSQLSQLSLTGRPVSGANVALDSVTGAGGAGLGNIAAQTIQDYNVKDASISYSKLTGTAQSQITALTTQDTPWSMLRRVTATGSALDANGKETDGLTVSNSATRVSDSLAYAGYAISNAGMTTTAVAAGGPGYSGLAPGKYQATFYVRLVSGTTAGTMLQANITGTNVTNATTALIDQTMLFANYQGFVTTFVVTATTAININLYSNMLPATGTWNFSHVHIEPHTGVVTSNTVDAFFASASITSAKVQSLSADKIIAGTIASDNIFLGSGGHIYAGTTQTSPTGYTARIELNSGGLYGYDGSQNTFSLTNSGLTLTGTVNATGGTLGNLTVNGTLTGGTITGTTITGATLNGTVTNSATINGGTIVGALIETTATSTASRTVLDNSHGLYVNIEATTNYVTNPSAEYFTNPNQVTTNWSWGSGGSVNSMAYDVVNGGTVLPMPPGHYMVAMGGSTADSVAVPIASGATSFQSNVSSIPVGQYVSFGSDPAIKITGSAAATAVSYAINNPGFETGSYANWTTAYQTTGSGATYSIASGQGHTGTYAASIATAAATDGGGIATDAYPIQAGDTVYATAWVKRSVASSSGFYLKVSWGNTSTFAYSGAGWLSESNWVANGATTTSYAQYGGAGLVAPAGATYFRVEVVNWSSSAAGTMYVDDLAVTVKATTTYTLASPTPNAYAVNSPYNYGEGEVRITMANLAASTTYTAQFNANASSATYFDALQGYVLEAAGAGRKYAMTYSSRFTPLPASTWSNFNWTFTTPADWAGPATLVLSTPRTATGALPAGTAAFAYLDNLQVEPKAYPTDYADGDYGNGYSWAGTAGTTASNRSNMRIVDFPHTLGQPTIRNVMTTDGLSFPLSNSVLIPDQLGGIGGLDLNGRGVQTTMATVQSTTTGNTYNNTVTNAGMVNSNNLSFRKGRLYKITYQNTGITVQTNASFYNFSCLIGSTTLAAVPGNTVAAGVRGMAGTWVWSYAPTSDVLGVTVTVVLNGGASGSTTVTHGYDYLEVTDMGIQR